MGEIKVDLREIGYEGVGGTQLVWNSFHCCCLVNTIKNYRVSFKEGNFLVS